MKYLIVGLGNIGEKYDETRHNIGFKVLDRLSIQEDLSWHLDRHALRAEWRYRGKTLIFIKPTTFMNLSGKAVRYWMDQEDISSSRILVVHDDIHLEYRTLRLRAKGSHAGHNGLKDIDRVLGHNKYPRLRMGIGDHFYPGQQVQYVLGQWTKEEYKYLDLIEECGTEVIRSFIHHGINQTMTAFNKRYIGGDVE